MYSKTALTSFSAQTLQERIAIAAQAVFLYSCAQVIIQLRHYDDVDRPLCHGEFIFFLVLGVLASTWMAANHRYEQDKDQRRKNTNMELGYCCIQAFLTLFTIYFEAGLVGATLVIAVYAVYILYINPKFMNRKLTR